MSDHELCFLRGAMAGLLRKGLVVVEGRVGMAAGLHVTLYLGSEIELRPGGMSRGAATADQYLS